MKYLILGGGPAGLSFAGQLLKKYGQDSFLLLEKENEAGGLCRSTDVDGFPFDIGGGHFLDVRRPAVNGFLFEYMPMSEWNKYERKSLIHVNGQYIDHPFEANIWQLDVEQQVGYLKSIALAGCNSDKEMPNEFVEWIYWKLGEKIAEDYMIPYNRKMFGNNLNQLGTYWLNKLPNVSFEETLLSCLNKKMYGEQPGHAEFFYPKKFGYGEIWKRMADTLGENIEYGKTVSSINFHTREVLTADGTTYKADNIIVTIPWTDLSEIIGLPEEIQKSISDLKYSSIKTEYFPENLDTDAHWTYFPDEALTYHRILVRHNFCEGSNGYWTETNIDRATDDIGVFSYVNKYAYPLNTIEKPKIMKSLLSYANEKSIYGLGRWGEWEHYNSDAVVEKGMQLADKLEGEL